MRIGIGYDVHKLVEHRPLVLGGVRIEHTLGLLGHSDADVLVHAIIDSLLGAAALGDIGKLFPDSDMKYANSNSLKLLGYVNNLLNKNGYVVNNIDSVIVAQNPRLYPYIHSMCERIAKTLNLDISCVSVKATTEEGLGFTGCGQGISAHAVCTITNI